MPGKGAIIIHGLAHARAALDAAAASGGPVILLSPPGGAIYAGAAWFRHVVERAAADHPGIKMTAVLDCGDAPGIALAALRQGVSAIRFSGTPAARKKIAAIARRSGAILYEKETPALDLKQTPDPAAACRHWLAKK